MSVTVTVRNLKVQKLRTIARLDESDFKRDLAAYQEFM